MLVMENMPAIYIKFQVKVVCETRDWEHSVELRKTLKERYAQVRFIDSPMAIPGYEMNE